MYPTSPLGYRWFRNSSIKSIPTHNPLPGPPSQANIVFTKPYKTLSENLQKCEAVEAHLLVFLFFLLPVDVLWGWPKTIKPLISQKPTKRSANK